MDNTSSKPHTPGCEYYPHTRTRIAVSYNLGLSRKTLFAREGSLPKNKQSLDALCRAAINIWEDFEEDLLNRLVLGMRKRLKAVIKAKGWYTNY
ncbi:hypothetical protein QBC38DRAFT_462288 [Podospora fimiseda]|uniref:Uncharacterized protein n=1 Tax=Podospora fimiseda TaxID=252190 RepID=A0AAN6YK10_9PEZI|nr:hypothetical protein QBC38DRAFT_462288 [Podospora fimiseda]